VTATRIDFVIAFSFRWAIDSESWLLTPLGFAEGLSLPHVFCFDKGFQAGQICAPESAVLVKPRVNRPKRLGIEPIDAVASFTVLVYQVRAAQQAKMLRDRRAGNWECSCNLSRGLAASP
jgi:hypothetical protein